MSLLGFTDRIVHQVRIKYFYFRKESNIHLAGEANITNEK